MKISDGEMKIGITGNNGFIGSHLQNYYRYVKGYEVITFEREFFNHIQSLIEFIEACDVVIHAAGINRHKDEQYLYRENIRLCTVLSRALHETKTKTHLIFTSSIHQNKETEFGRSKKECSEILKRCGMTHDHVTVTNLIIPNVFGPFCKPNYNSVVATFCSSTIKNEQINISENQIGLIYIDELIQEFENHINKPISGDVNVDETINLTIIKLFELIQYFDESYRDKNIIPELASNFEINLFNTYRSYIEIYNSKIKLSAYHDSRGSFCELTKHLSKGQFSVSYTNPTIERGNHFHTRKIERFMVLKGTAEIYLRKVDSTQIHKFRITGEELCYIDIPIWYTHSIVNIGEDELITAFWINEHYNENDSDTYILETRK